MAPQSWFRLAVNRLSFLTRPIPLVSTLVVLLLGVFIWEYNSHPEWFGAYSQDGESPNTDVDLSGLTPEEQAAVANIDNLSVLSNDFGVAAEDPPEGSGSLTTEDVLENSFLQGLLSPTTTSDGEQINSNRFEQYLQQYQFLGRSAQNNLPAQPPLYDLGTPSTDEFRFSGLASPNDINDFANETSALGVALQGSGSEAEDSSLFNISNLTRLSDGQSEDANASSQGTASASASSAAELSNASGDLGTQGVAVPGVPFPVLSPSVQTSPPPGTTGYTPPASLQPISPSNTGNASPGAETVPLPLGSNSGGLNIPSTAGNLNLSVPQVGSGGNTGSLTPLPSTIAPATPAPTASPFSVPRPPGSYTGGGYINTFSNPGRPTNSN